MYYQIQMVFTKRGMNKMDILALYVILLTVVIWIIGTLMWVEIDKLKEEAEGIENKKGKDRYTVGIDCSTKESIGTYIWVNEKKDNPPFGGSSEQSENNYGRFIEPELWGIPELEKRKVYYFCHPCTTGGKSIEENKASEEVLYQKIMKRNPGAKIIRPLTLIPERMSHIEAMKKCFALMSIANGIILPSGWTESKGCTMECEKALIKKMDIMLLRTS